SSFPPASVFPSGPKVIALMAPERPWSVWRSVPVAGSHSLIVASRLALASVPASGLKATAPTPAECPRSARNSLPVARSHTPVRADVDRAHARRLPAERLALLPGRQVPELDRAVQAAADERPAVPGVDERGDGAAVAGERPHLAQGRRRGDGRRPGPAGDRQG